MSRVTSYLWQKFGREKKLPTVLTRYIFRAQIIRGQKSQRTLQTLGLELSFFNLSTPNTNILNYIKKKLNYR